MAELDFSKIFGETATSKAEFTSENYMRGWGYLGSTPPPYQLFDYLQSQNDKKAKYLYDRVMESDSKFVKKNGDTMTGNLAVNNGTEFSAVEVDNATGGKLLFESMANNASAIGHIIYRNGSSTEAKLNLPKKTGVIATLEDTTQNISAHNSSSSAHPLITNAIAKILGTSSWQSNPADNLKHITDLLGFGGIVAQRLETNGYVKFANNFTIQWGYITNVKTGRVTYITAFNNESLGVGTTVGALGNPVSVSVSDHNTTGFNYMAESTTNIRWIVVGW